MPNHQTGRDGERLIRPSATAWNVTLTNIRGSKAETANADSHPGRVVFHLANAMRSASAGNR